MEVTLISPYCDIRAFGIRTLSACLKKEGYDVRLIFLPRFFTHRYNDIILNELVQLSKTSDLIGISLMTNSFDNVVQITQKLKKESDIPVLWGGTHPTIRPEECLNHADMVCIGEGEEALVNLVKKMENGKDYRDVRGIWFKDKESVITNKVGPLIQDLDYIPFPDYDYESHYVTDGGHIRKMKESFLERHMYNKSYMSITTRGCPLGCSYCCNNTINRMYLNQKIVRKRTPDNIIKELREIKNRLPFIDRITFDDDSFLFRTTDEIREFCGKYKENIGLPMAIGGVTPSTLTGEKLSLLVDGGLAHIRMGIQSGSERAKKLYKRSYSNLQVEGAAGIINNFKDKIKEISYDIILDNPWETDEDLVETLVLLTKLPPPYRLSLFSLTFYPETDIYRMAKRDAIITDDMEGVYRKYYHKWKRTYLNKLFFLISQYAGSGQRLSTKTILLLTNRKLSRLKLTRLLYALLKLWIIPFSFLHLLQTVVKEVRKGDWSRIVRFIEKIFRRLSPAKNSRLKVNVS
jgi:radical SAM superfamily enzyme YgiQ (UPF0313 family)